MLRPCSLHVNRFRRFQSSFKQKLKNYGPSTFFVYGSLDGILFISSAIAIHFAQDKILERLSDFEFIKKVCPKGVHEEVHEKSEKISKWTICKYTGLDAKDVVAFGISVLILRSPVVSMPYRATVLLRIEKYYLLRCR